MKVKHLFFSSLILSAGFAACTSEVEEFTTQAPSTEAPKGIELGEGFTVNVANGGFTADAETRAEFSYVDGIFTPSWVSTDSIGAARYNMILTKNTDGDVIACWGDFTNTGYMSNDGFGYIGDNKFQSASNSMAGAYVLYFPYDKSLNESGQFNEINVYNEEKATAELEFDVEDITKQINERIFAANIVEFNKGGSQAPGFKLKQVPNLFALNFEVQDKKLMSLEKPVKIKSIIVEANNGTTSSININGKIEPQDMLGSGSGNAAKYNEDENGNNKLGGIKWTGTKKADVLTVDVKNESGNQDYMLVTAGEKTVGKFFFTALPFDADVTTVSFKIIADVDGVDKVYGKTVSPSGKLKTWLTGMGQVVNVNVVLDTEHEDDVIYTLNQFNAMWANREGTANSFTLGVNLDVEQSLATAEGETVTFKGGKLTAQDLTGNFVFENDIEAANVEGTISVSEGKTAAFSGNVTATGASSFKGTTKIAGIVTADKAITFSGETTIDSTVIANAAIDFNKTATINDNVVANAAITFAKDATIEGNVTATDNITFKEAGYVNGNVETSDAVAAKSLSAKNITTTGEMDVTETLTCDTIFATAGADIVAKAATVKQVEINDAIVQLTTATINGDANVANGSSFNGSNVTVKDVTLTESFATISTLSANNISVDLESKLEAKSKLTAQNMDVTGDAIVKVAELADLTINSTGLVEATGSKATSTIENVTIVAGNNKKGQLDAVNITLGTVTNDGVLNADAATINNIENNSEITGSFTVAGLMDQNGTADATTITVAENAILNVNANTEVKALTNNGTVNVAKKFELSHETTGKITNNSVITVNGTLTETKKNYLINSDNATIYVEKGATLTYFAADDALKPGVVMVKNDAVLTNVSTTNNKIVGYEWTGTYKNAPKKALYEAINTIYVKDLTITNEQNATANGKMPADLSKKNLIFNGNVVLKSALTMSNGYSVAFAEDVVISGTNNLTIKGVNNTIASGKTLTLVDPVKIGGASGNWLGTGDINSKLTLGAGAQFNGSKANKLLDIAY